MALVEIDVLVAQALGLSCNELVDMYRIHFPVLRQNEEKTWYDATGRIVWTASKGLPGVGFLENGKTPSYSRWLELKDRDELTCDAMLDFLPDDPANGHVGPKKVSRRFVGPFTTCNRVEQYRRAWEHFDSSAGSVDLVAAE